MLSSIQTYIVEMIFNRY